MDYSIVSKTNKNKFIVIFIKDKARKGKGKKDLEIVRKPLLCREIYTEDVIELESCFHRYTLITASGPKIYLCIKIAR